MANRLKEVRRANGDLPLRAINVKSGVNMGTLSAIERWDYRPTPDTCRRIAEALGVTVEDIWPAENRQPAEVGS